MAPGRARTASDTSATVGTQHCPALASRSHKLDVLFSNVRRVGVQKVVAWRRMEGGRATGPNAPWPSVHPPMLEILSQGLHSSCLSPVGPTKDFDRMTSRLIFRFTFAARNHKNHLVLNSAKREQLSPNGGAVTLLLFGEYVSLSNTVPKTTFVCFCEFAVVPRRQTGQSKGGQPKSRRR